MTNAISRTSHAPKPAAAPALTPADLGKKITVANAAELKLTEATKAFEAAKAELAKATPQTHAAAERKLKAAEGARDKAFDVASAAGSEVKAALSKLEGPKLAKKTERLFAAYEQAVKARDASKAGTPQRQQLDAAVTLLAQKLEARENENLIKAKWKPDHTNAEANLDGLADLASRSREDQIRLAGAPVVTVNNDQAVAFDRQKVSYSLKLSSSSGLQMLSAQFEGADEATQLKLLAQLGQPGRDRLSQLISGAGQPGNGSAFAEVLSNAKGAARQQLLDRVAQTVSGPSHDLVRWLGGGLQYGDRMAVAGEFVQALKKAGKSEIADGVMASAAKDIGKLRTDYLSSRKVVDKLNAEFARTVTGFAGAVDPKALEAYRDRFVKEHQAEFSTFDRASDAYVQIFKGAATGAFGDLNVNPLSGEGQLRTELSLVTDKHVDVLDSKAGREALDSAMKLQMLKQPSWLDQLSSDAKPLKNYLKLPAKVADFAAKSMIRIGVGKGLDQGQLNLLIEKNSGLLGITPKAAKKFNEVLNEINNSGLSDAQRAAAYEKAAGEIKAGGYGGKSLAALGVLLTAPGVMKGLFNFKDQDLLGKLSTGIETLSLGKDLVSLFSDAKVLGTVGKFAGGAGAAIGLVKSVMSLSDGKLFEGGMGLASSVGGALMLVPGGQLFGAALVLGSAIASAIWAKDPAAEAEAKQEGKVRDFLVSAGLKPEIAEELSDVLQKNHRTMGPFIEQMAKYLDLKPSEFLQFLNEQPPGKVRSMVKMVKEMPSDDQWKFRTSRKEGADVGDTTGAYAGNGVAATWTIKDPQSLETAKAWLAKHDMMPPNAK